jgi:hypothetical protein
MKANWPIPAAMAGSQRTAARLPPGPIYLSSSSHFALKRYSYAMKPAAIADEARTERVGDDTSTIGSVRVACNRVAGVRGLLIHCSEYHRSHSIAITGDQWPDQVSLSD